MKQINHWPDITELALPESASQDLRHRLLEPFDDEASAKEFWNETSTTLIILDPTDNITPLQQDTAWNQIDFTLTYSEYTLPLSMDYQLLVAIVNDSGSGIYLVVPPEESSSMSQIIRRALKILESRMTQETDFFNNPEDTKKYLRLKARW